MVHLEWCLSVLGVGARPSTHTLDPHLAPLDELGSSKKIRARLNEPESRKTNQSDRGGAGLRKTNQGTAGQQGPARLIRAPRDGAGPCGMDQVPQDESEPRGVRARENETDQGPAG